MVEARQQRSALGELGRQASHSFVMPPAKRPRTPCAPRLGTQGAAWRAGQAGRSLLAEFRARVGARQPRAAGPESGDRRRSQKPRRSTMRSPLIVDDEEDVLAVVAGIEDRGFGSAVGLLRERCDDWGAVRRVSCAANRRELWPCCTSRCRRRPGPGAPCRRRPARPHGAALCGSAASCAGGSGARDWAAAPLLDAHALGCLTLRRSAAPFEDAA
jgi:hypothetical protein